MNTIVETGRVIFDPFHPGYLYLPLSKPADPLTVCCFYGDTVKNARQIIPIELDIFGHPHFLSSKKFPLDWHDTITVTYNLLDFNVPRENFDTIEAIEQADASLSTLHELLNLRTLFASSHPGEPLTEFLYRGYFLLDSYGQCIPIGSNPRFKGNRDIIAKPFVRVSHIHFSGQGDSIPEANSKCAFCGEVFTTSDIPCVRLNDDYYHKTCSNKLGHFNHVK